MGFDVALAVVEDVDFSDDKSLAITKGNEKKGECVPWMAMLSDGRQVE